MAQTLENLSDEGLMERVQKNDHQAFSVLVRRRTDMFYAAAYRMVMNQQDAEDVVQDAFLKIWDRPQIWKAGKGAKFTTWFYRIVVNSSIDKLRQVKSDNVSDLEEVVSNNNSQEYEMTLNEEQKALEEAITELPEKQMLALNLCFYEGLSNKEAAEIMKVSVKALESLLMRAKSGLRDKLHRAGILEQGDVA